MKKFLYCLLVFLIIGSAVGGAVLFSNLSYSDNRGGDFNTPQNSITATAPENTDLWTDSGNYATSFAGGDGQSEATAYRISTPEQLARLAYLINSSQSSSYRSKYYKQTADIDLSAHYWESIGSYTSSSYYFSGHYDGGGYEISGLYTQAGSTDDYSYQGLFGYVRGQSETNRVVIENVGIIDSHVQGYSYVGGVVGYADDNSTITNSYNAGSVTGRGSNVGGVVGYAYDFDIANCYNTGNITGDDDRVGGVVGYTYFSTITNCYNTGNVTGSDWYTGGVVGYVEPSSIENCYNTGSVSGSSFIGGVVGYILNSPIENCYNTGSVSASNGYVGGVVGSANYLTITNCYNAGEVTGGSDTVGGVVGSARHSTITNCNNTGSVTGSGEDVGGVVGSASDTTITNCYNIGDVISTYTEVCRIGGLVGSASNTTIENCYNTGPVKGSGDNVGGVVGSATDSSDIINCYNTGNVTGSGDNVGGVVGYAWGSTITNCYNTGAVSGSSYVGGVVGWANSSTTTNFTITNCYNTGAVTGSGEYVGGVVGRGDELITNCYNTGAVTGGGYVGGVVGGVDYRVTIINCYNTGSVKGSGEDVGGVVGYAWGSTITNCYNTGTVTGNRDVGGVVGSVPSTVTTNCYNTGSVTGDRYVGGVVGSPYSNSTITNNYYGGNCTLSYGTGNSSNSGASKDSNLIANAKSLNWYQDTSKWNSAHSWDFEEVWSLVPSANDGYPILQGFSVNISYNSNFGETITEQVPSGQEIVIAGYDLFTRVGYEISHWNTKPDGSGLNFYAGDTYSDVVGITLYAVWEPAVYRIELNANGGSGGLSAMYVKYGAGFYSNSAATAGLSSLSNSNLPTRAGYTLLGFYTANSTSSTCLISVTTNSSGVRTGTFTDAFTTTYFTGPATLYAQWRANNPAYYDEEGGYWYIENGKLPQSRVSGSLKTTLQSSWGNLETGSTYTMDATGDMVAKIYEGNEYCAYNGEYYRVEPIRWRLTYNANQEVGYGASYPNINLAIMATIVYAGRYSIDEVGAGEGYVHTSVEVLKNNQISSSYVFPAQQVVTAFGTGGNLHNETGGSRSPYAAEPFVACRSNIMNVAGDYSVKFSDLVLDYLYDNGSIPLYYTCDIGTNYNQIICLTEDGQITQRQPNLNYLGVQFGMSISQYACVER